MHTSSSPTPARCAAGDARRRPAAQNPPRADVVDPKLRELLDATGMPILYTSGRNYRRTAGACITFPDRRWLRFPVRGTRQANAIMTAVDQAGNKIARYRVIGMIKGTSMPQFPGLWKAIEITVHPGQPLTGELTLAIAISASWPQLVLCDPRGRGRVNVTTTPLIAASPQTVRRRPTVRRAPHARQNGQGKSGPPVTRRTAGVIEYPSLPQLRRRRAGACGPCEISEDQLRFLHASEVSRPAIVIRELARRLPQARRICPHPNGPGDARPRLRLRGGRYGKQDAGGAGCQAGPVPSPCPRGHARSGSIAAAMLVGCGSIGLRPDH
jgi:hypothetical protein